MSSIAIRGVTKTYEGRPPVRALRGVDLDVRAGTFAAVLGPSGCGKTTLLRVLAGLERPDDGTVGVGDRALDHGGVHLPPERRRVGLVPQEGALFPHLDVAANIAFGLRRSPRGDRDDRVRELLDLVGLWGLGDRRPHELSGGQQQRVALARALAPRPDVILLDEPFSALDAALRTSLREQVADVLRDTGTTAVLVTHDQDEALSLADEIAVMRDGRIVQVGSPAALYQHPVDLWTARFLGDAIVLPGRRSDADPRQVDTALGRLRLDPVPDSSRTAEVTVLIRPEQVVRDPSGGNGTVAAVVEDVRFRGAFADLALRIGTEAVVARWPSTSLPAVGDDVGVCVEGPVVAFASP